MSKLDNWIDALVDYFETKFPNKGTVHFEVWNESFHGQEALNVMNGLPPNAHPSEVKGQFNDWLAPLVTPPK